MSPVRIWEAGLTVPKKCPGSVVAYHDCLSRNRLGFEFRPGRCYNFHFCLSDLLKIVYNSSDPAMGPGGVAGKIFYWYAPHGALPEQTDGFIFLPLDGTP